MVKCPVCSKEIPLTSINTHLDSNCAPSSTTIPQAHSPKKVALIFQTPSKKPPPPPPAARPNATISQKRPLQDPSPPSPKKLKSSTSHLRSAMPLAEKVRPGSLDEICGQELVGVNGVLRGLIEEGRVPSMILWGAAGCGKTTIARVVAGRSGSRFIEISATASGVSECKKIFAEARSELALTGRRTILFCDEIHRYCRVAKIPVHLHNGMATQQKPTQMSKNQPQKYGIKV